MNVANIIYKKYCFFSKNVSWLLLGCKFHPPFSINYNTTKQLGNNKTAMETCYLNTDQSRCSLFLFEHSVCFIAL